MPQLTQQSGTTTGADTVTAMIAQPQPIDPLVSIRAFRFNYPDTFYVRYFKRAFDLVAASVLLAIFAPIILATGVAILMTSGAPVFYASERIGRGGKPFRMWKLRTMCRDAEGILQAWLVDPVFAEGFRARYKIENDPRITRFGRFLRRTSLDELPQLLNVIRGEMSLVGPRPLVQSELDHFGPRAPELLSVRPGVTGIWQVAQRHTTYPHRVFVELAAVRDSSLANDVAVLLRTLLVPLRFDGR